MPKTYIITGLPRSGTTLLTSLLSENINAITFSEPNWLKEIRQETTNSKEFTHLFEKKITSLRNDILNRKPVLIKSSRFNKGLPENYYHRTNKGQIVVDKDEVPFLFPRSYFDKPFIIKANAQFTSCLSELINQKQYIIIALIRNPIPIIMSWRSLTLPVSKGKMKVAEKYSNGFKAETNGQTLLQKQVLIADWFFKQFNKYKHRIHIIKYESLILETNKTISKISGISNTNANANALKSKNDSKHYNQNEKSMIIKEMEIFCKYYKNFYTL